MSKLDNVSIIMPVFNEKNTIKKVIDKIISLSPHEIILVDDGSSDGTRDVLEKIKSDKIKSAPATGRLTKATPKPRRLMAEDCGNRDFRNNAAPSAMNNSAVLGAMGMKPDPKDVSCGQPAIQPISAINPNAAATAPPICASKLCQLFIFA